MNHNPPDMSKVAGGWAVPQGISPNLLGCKAAPKVEFPLPYVYLAKHVIGEKSCDDINKFLDTNAPTFAPVSIQGLQATTPETTGSFRSTTWNIDLAKQLEKLFEHVNIPKKKHYTNYSPTDWYQDGAYQDWEYVGVSPMLRTMRYKAGGQHFAHYDAGYLYPNPNYRTLVSFVIYLSTNKTGATRIINDDQHHIPVWGRNHRDWVNEADETEVLFSSFPVKGSVLFFEHRVCHDVSKFIPESEGEERRIIRGDLIFKRTGL